MSLGKSHGVRVPRYNCGIQPCRWNLSLGKRFQQGNLPYESYRQLARSLSPSIWAVKIIWIDEHDPNQSKVTVAILHDRVAGQVLPMTGAGFVSDPPETQRNGYWGLRGIARYPIYTGLKGNEFWNKLKVRKGDDSSSRAVNQLVEYAVLDWLAERAPAYDLIDSTEITLIHGGGGQQEL